MIYFYIIWIIQVNLVIKIITFKENGKVLWLIQRTLLNKNQYVRYFKIVLSKFYIFKIKLKVLHNVFSEFIDAYFVLKVKQ